MAKRAQPSFPEALAMMRKRNPQTAEDGFQFLRSLATEHVSELMHEFGAERDHGVKCWLLELIGEARSAEAFELLCAQATSPDTALRDWAILGLKQLDSADTRTFLFQRGLK